MVGHDLPDGLRDNLELLAEHFSQNGQLSTLFLDSIVSWDAFVAPVNAGHAAVADFPLSGAAASAITTNYDRLIEDAASRMGAYMVAALDNDEQALNAFAHDVAVGIAGLCMEQAGFIWRAHAKEELPAARRPDYVWTQTLAATKVTLSEVKGMAGSSRSFATLKSKVHEAFDEEVHPWRRRSTLSGTPITGGYAIGVRVSHSTPGEVAAVRSIPMPSLPGSLSTVSPLPLPFGPDPLVVRNHYAAALALMGLGGMSRRIAGLPPLPPPDIYLNVVQVEDM